MMLERKMSSFHQRVCCFLAQKSEITKLKTHTNWHANLRSTDSNLFYLISEKTLEWVVSFWIFEKQYRSSILIFLFGWSHWLWFCRHFVFFFGRWSYCMPMAIFGLRDCFGLSSDLAVPFLHRHDISSSAWLLLIAASLLQPSFLMATLFSCKRDSPSCWCCLSQASLCLEAEVLVLWCELAITSDCGSSCEGGVMFVCHFTLSRNLMSNGNGEFECPKAFALR